MNTSRLLLAGLLLGTSVSLGGCVVARVPVPLPNPRVFVPSAFLPPETYIVTDETARQRAEECAGQSGDLAPGIMTYDSRTHVETHQDSYRDSTDVSVQDHDNNRVTGIHLEAGEYPRRTDLCVADGRDIHRIQRMKSGRDLDRIRRDYSDQRKDDSGSKDSDDDQGH